MAPRERTRHIINIFLQTGCGSPKSTMQLISISMLIHRSPRSHGSTIRASTTVPIKPYHKRRQSMTLRYYVSRVLSQAIRLLKYRSQSYWLRTRQESRRDVVSSFPLPERLTRSLRAWHRRARTTTRSSLATQDIICANCCCVRYGRNSVH